MKNQVILLKINIKHYKISKINKNYVKLIEK